MVNGVEASEARAALADRMAALSWAHGPATAFSDWPASLRSAVILALDLPAPALLACGPEGALAYNPAAAAVLGDLGESALGRPFPIVLGSLGLQTAETLLARALSGESFHHPGVRLMPAGDTRAGWQGALALAPIRSEAGETLGALCLLHEAAPAPTREQALRTDPQRYRALFDSMDEGFCIIEFIDSAHGPLSDYVHIEANPAYERHAGIPNVVGQKVREMVPDEAAGWVELYGEVLRTGAPVRFERELVATGRHLELAAFRIEPAELNQVAVLFQDVTPRRRAEAELRKLNETLEARVAEALAERRLLADLVEAADALVQVLDHDLRWIAINGAAVREYKRLFGVEPAVGARLPDLLAHRPDDLAQVSRVFERALAGESFVEVETFGGGSSYEMRVNPLLGPRGEIVGGHCFAYDVTERLHEQERLREAEESLRQAQKMEAVGQLTGGLAHDFNNLLAGISGAFEMITTRLAQGRSADVERYLVAGQGATRRAAALTHRLLAFSRRQTLSPRSVVINRLLADFVELVRRTVGPSVQLETVAASGLWPTLVDANQLENALLNLCINARDAMPHGGQITIETANKWLDVRAAKNLGVEPGQYVTVCVSDTGMGIDKETLSRVFDPFFTTKPIGQGTGLGLSMVYGFARQSHGHVRIYSEVGEGTMVCVYLPRHLGEEDQDPAQHLSLTPAAVQGRTVLVIDDEPTVRMLVADALGELGCSVLEAADGAAGLRILESGSRIDLLITDVGLPAGLNGRQVADAARILRPELKVLFITGYAENAILNHGHVERGMEVLTKPFAVDDLTERVDRLLREAEAGG